MENSGQNQYRQSGTLVRLKRGLKLDFKKYFTQNFNDLGKIKNEIRKISMTKYQKLFANTQDIAYFGLFRTGSFAVCRLLKRQCIIYTK